MSEEARPNLLSHEEVNRLLDEALDDMEDETGRADQPQTENISDIKYDPSVVDQEFPVTREVLMKNLSESNNGRLTAEQLSILNDKLEKLTKVSVSISVGIFTIATFLLAALLYFALFFRH